MSAAYRCEGANEWLRRGQARRQIRIREIFAVLSAKLRNFRYARHEYARWSLCRDGAGANIYGRIIQASRYTRSPMYYADTRIDFQYLAAFG